MQRFKDYSKGDKAFVIFVGIILTLFFIAVLYPCVFVISASFSSGTAVQSGRVVLFPVDFSLDGYKTVFNTPTIWTGYRNSIDRKSTRLNSSHPTTSRMPSSA